MTPHFRLLLLILQKFADTKRGYLTECHHLGSIDQDGTGHGDIGASALGVLNDLNLARFANQTGKKALGWYRSWHWICYRKRVFMERSLDVGIVTWSLVCLCLAIGRAIQRSEDLM